VVGEGRLALVVMLWHDDAQKYVGQKHATSEVSKSLYLIGHGGTVDWCTYNMLNSQELCMELKFSAQPRAAVGERDG
jgi:hypothetical protein